MNEVLYRARKPGRCDRCGTEIPKRKRFYFGTSMGYEDGLLANFRLCMSCAAADDAGMGCQIREEDPADPDVRARIAAGLRTLRSRVTKRFTRRR